MIIFDYYELEGDYVVGVVERVSGSNMYILVFLNYGYY